MRIAGRLPPEVVKVQDYELCHDAPWNPDNLWAGPLESPGEGE